MVVERNDVVVVCACYLEIGVPRSKDSRCDVGCEIGIDLISIRFDLHDLICRFDLDDILFFIFSLISIMIDM
jgi:hypothetical protein